MFCTEAEFKQMKEAETPDILNELLSRVHNSAIEKALCLIPDVVQKMSKKLKYTSELFQGFFDDNKVFLENQDIVFQTIQEIEFEFPGLGFAEVLEKAKPIIERRIANAKSA